MGGRLAILDPDGQPRLEGSLGSKAVKLQGRQKADHTVRYAEGSGSEAVVLRGLESRRRVEPSPQPFQLASLDQSADGGTRRPFGF